MRKMTVVIATCVCFACLGCSDKPPALPPSPHDGEMFALPDGQGWVELRNEEQKAVGKVRQGMIVACFFKPDRQTPLDSQPTDVKATLDDENGRPTTVPLTPSAGSDGATRFASKVGPVILKDLPGDLSGKLGSTPFTVKFRARRR